MRIVSVNSSALSPSSIEEPRSSTSVCALDLFMPGAKKITKAKKISLYVFSKLTPLSNIILRLLSNQVNRSDKDVGKLKIDCSAKVLIPMLRHTIYWGV